MFNWFKKKKTKYNSKEIRTFVCKHCKLTCKDCDNIYCFSCFVNPKNPCPRCGKTNDSYIKPQSNNKLATS